MRLPMFLRPPAERQLTELSVLVKAVVCGDVPPGKG
jgi:hypothetical protein